MYIACTDAKLSLRVKFKTVQKLKIIIIIKNGNEKVQHSVDYDCELVNLSCAKGRRVSCPYVIPFHCMHRINNMAIDLQREKILSRYFL